ncbi:hypothetical protein EOM86_11630 [Candidatus Nomurabacteria bacterium]|nr:hypothetical protein [Candidatus Nomurabacteria bacterium]
MTKFKSDIVCSVAGDIYKIVRRGGFRYDICDPIDGRVLSSWSSSSASGREDHLSLYIHAHAMYENFSEEEEGWSDFWSKCKSNN